jgi:GTP-binding protein
LKVESAQYIRSAHAADDFLAESIPEIAIAGRSNVGKSSLLNRLLGRKRLARISSSPGHTRAVNYFLVNDCFFVVDLPGYGYAKVAKTERKAWGELIARYISQAEDRVHMVQLVDSKVGATALDIQAVGYLRSLNCEPTIVATKVDKVSSSRRHRAMADIRSALSLSAGQKLVPFSARTGEGLQELWGEISVHLN